MRATPRILAIRACAVGDFVLHLPALTALKKTLPDARWTLVGNPAGLELAREFLAVDAVYSIDLPPWSTLFWDTVKDLKFDAAFVWMKDPVVANQLAASGVPKVIRADPFPEFGHAADHLLRTLGLPRPPLPDFWRPRLEEIVVHPGSGSPAKNWPFYKQLIARLPEARLLPEGLSLVELARYLSGVRGFIGNDSGITHIAAYWGCPTVALFGPTDPRKWGPIGRRSRVIWKTRLEDISVDEVLSLPL
jgi:ADP-heptose:LPS heptosyltransferase